MQYLFASELPQTIANGEIFKSNNAIGYIKNGEIHIENNNKKYVYKHGEWYLNDFPCGIGAVPAIDIDNLQIIDNTTFINLLYTPPTEE